MFVLMPLRSVGLKQDFGATSELLFGVLLECRCLVFDTPDLDTYWRTKPVGEAFTAKLSRDKLIAEFGEDRVGSFCAHMVIPIPFRRSEKPPAVLSYPGETLGDRAQRLWIPTES